MANVVDIRSDSDDFDSKRPAPPAKRKVPESPVAKAKTPGSVEKVRRSVKPKPPLPSMPPPPSVGPPQPAPAAPPAVVPPSVSPFKSIRATTDGFLGTPPASLSQPDDDLLDVVWQTDLRLGKPSSQEQNVAAARAPPMRPPERSEKPQPAKRPLDFEVQTMEPALSSLLEALEKPAALPPTPANALRSNSSPSSASVIQRSPVSQTRHLAIKSPAAAASPAPTQHTPSPPADAQPVSAQATTKPAPLTIADLIASPAAKPPPASLTAAKPPAPSSAKPSALSRSTSASIISSSPLPPPLPSVAKPAPQSPVAPATLPPPPPSPTALVPPAPKAMLASPAPAVVRTNTAPVLESPVVAKADLKAPATSPAPSLVRSNTATAAEPPIAMKAEAKFATPASVVKPAPATAKTPAVKPPALAPAPAPSTPVLKPSASAAAATPATLKAPPAAAAPCAPSPAPAPSTPKPFAVAPTRPMPSVQQAIAASRAPKQAPAVARASSLPAQPPKPAGVTAASSATLGTSAPRATSLPSLPVHAPSPARSAAVKPPGAVKPPPPADPEPALGPGGDFLSDDQLDLLLSDPVTLSQIDQWTAAPAAQNDSAPPLPPTPRLSAPLSNVRFPPGAPHNVHRLRVQSVAQVEERAPPGQPKRSRTFTKRLTVRDERSGLTRFVTLKDEWVDLEIAPDDFVNVIGDFDAEGNCTVDCNNNSLIHYPDTLVNITLITSTNHCLRKSILGERYRGYSQSSDAVYGTLIHGVFQSVLHRGDFSDDAFQRAITREIDASLGALFAVGETEQDARERLRSFIPNLQAWHKSFVDSGGGDGDGNNAPGNAAAAPPLQRSVSFGKQQNVPIAIPKILEIEESISSPVYGIKGKIDVSVEVASIDGRMRFVAPLELKGGKKHGSDGSVYHKAQVYLYMLLMTERYRQEVDKGLLFYLAADMEGLRQDPNMKRSLLVNRNQVARHLANNTLPPPLRNPFKCGNCQSLSLCMVVHKSSEGGTVESSGLGDTFTRTTAHVSEEHAAFLRLWDRIVDLEAAENVRQQPWLHTSVEQERRGRCLADMVLERQEAAAGAFLYTFRKRLSPLEQASPTSQSSRTSLLDLFEATRGDFVTLSTEDGHYGVARGSIVELAPQFIVIALDDELRVLPRVPAAAPAAAAAAQDKTGAQPVPLEALFDVERVFECLTPGSERQGEARHHHRGRPALRDANGKHTWRIDREDLVSTEGTIRNNVAMLFTPPESRLRALVVDLAPPQFDFAAGDERLARLSPQSLRSLNGDQRRSLHMVLAARDYALILGMPGTGKSTTIVSIVQALVALGHSVLITSYTNNAVDNLLLKLAAANVDFLRISSRRRESAKELEKYTLNSVRHNSLAEYRQFVEARQVVGATCLNAHHAVIARRRFDYCIVDEASQITLPICVGPLRYANVFVLVGDHYQLPPVVRSSGAHELGGDVSLFRRLAERHSNALAALEYQYRMNKEIMALPNALVYEGRLQCGTQSIASRRLSLPGMPALVELVGPSHWLITGVNPAQANVFFNTDALGRNEQKAEGATTTGGGVYNKTEVKLIARLVQALVVAGLDPSKIGVIAAYRAQLRFIRYGLGEPLRTLVEVDTVDRYQGRDKDCIIMSLVRANDRGEVGELLLDARRLNVALSRAKCKLIVVGSQGTFAPAEIYASLFKILAEQNSIFELPPDAPTLGAAEVASGAAKLLQASAMAGQSV